MSSTKQKVNLIIKGEHVLKYSDSIEIGDMYPMTFNPLFLLFNKKIDN